MPLEYTQNSNNTNGLGKISVFFGFNFFFLNNFKGSLFWLDF